MYRDSTVQCPTCDKTLKGSSLNSHMYNVHTHERAYPCRLCPEVFHRRTVLICHMKMVHKIGCFQEKKHECHLCGQKFIKADLVRNHIRTIHEQLRDHMCDICGAKFKYLHALKNHKKIHSGKCYPISSPSILSSSLLFLPKITKKGSHLSCTTF